ncbi:M20 aminoacylase family protein [Rubellimicrobium aerolatum]|uniref:M20 aminoacylase family protein n=1 Tax=Rubellimicrobium aerolatum TaxID=490979 RepID=A0ABW0S7G2_9RHOB|nr:M20 aminoacylase family protein [Rubellimicrobium aerolatum]MBP1804518.1 hippurate hydrolase [Rubellimicrobium aerolatum]
MPVVNRIAALADDMAAWRHAIHRRPELGFDLPETSRFVAERLREFGVDELHEGIARSGVVALIHGQRPGPAVALRADMDALPMDEQSGVPYASEIPGRMHACGHDGHTAMLLGAARYLAETRNFAGTAVLLFQPAEEQGGGGQVMVREGVLDRFHVREVHALHIAPGVPVGEFATTPGPIMAAVDDFTVTLTGQGGHAAYPHDALDPVPAACALVGALQTIPSRNADPMKQLVLSVTQVHAGSAFNVIPDRATVGGTIRSYDKALHALARRRLGEVAQGTAAAFGLSATVEFIEGYPPTINDAARTAFAVEVAQEVGTRVEDRMTPEMGAEDFSFLLEQRPGAFVMLGNGDTPMCHHPAFVFDDRALPLGASYLARVIERALPVTE